MTLIQVSQLLFSDLEERVPDAVVLALMSWALGVESIDCLSWVGILGAVAANVLIVRPAFLFGDVESVEWDVDRFMGLLCSVTCVLSLCSGFLIIGYVPFSKSPWSRYAVCGRRIDKTVPSLVIGNHAAVQLMVISVPFLVVGYPEKILWRASAAHIGYYLLGSCGPLNQIFIVRAFQIGPPVKAGMCSLVRVLLTVSSGVIFFSEEITFLHAIGGVILLSSITLVIWRRDLAKKKIIQERLVNEIRSDSSP